MAEMSEGMVTWLTMTGDFEWYTCAVREDRLDEIAAYLRGLGTGIYVFAWWKDGKQYVGSTGRTMEEALEIIKGEIARLEEGEREEGLLPPASD